MSDSRLKSAHWSYALFLVAAVTVGCGRAEPDPVSRSREQPAVNVVTNKAGADLEAESPSVEAEAEHGTSERKPIYDDEADGAELIAAALNRARWEHKHVLIEWGGNACGWCYKLHDLFTRNDQVHPIVLEEYELVLVDSGANRSLMESFGGPDREYSYPHLTILDADGKVLVNQNTEPLENGSQHDPAKVAGFLEKWTPEPLDAETQLTSALQRAGKEDKRVFMRVGTPYCVWCGVLSRFLLAHEPLLASDYIDLKIDTMRMTHGGDVAERFQPSNSLGIPWMVILDSSGKVLASSVGQDGNCGYPYYPQEIDHFIGMLTTTRQKMTDEDLAALQADLEAYREEREQTNRARRRGGVDGTSAQ